MRAETEASPAADPEQQSSRVPRWIVLATALALAGVVGVIVYGYLAMPGWMGVSDKKFWDYLELLIVPGVLALGVYWLNRRQAERDQQAEVAQQERELAVENQRAQDAALQAYLDQMGQLLLHKDKPLRQSKEGDEVRILARARTLNVLSRLNKDRKRSVLDFLLRTSLINREFFDSFQASRVVTMEQTMVDLSWADLSETFLIQVNLSGANLRMTDLREVILYQADLRGAALSGANMEKADLIAADLTGAELVKTTLKGGLLLGTDLSEALLMGANLEDANLTLAKLIGSRLEKAVLSGADLTSADLSNAILSDEVWLVDTKLEGANLTKADLNGAYMNGARLNGATLRDADLRNAALLGADLSGADLSGANLSNAIAATEEQLDACKSLAGATMPNGQKYEDWLGTPEGQDWLRKYKKDLGEKKKIEGVYEDWKKTIEGKMWLKAVGEDGENGSPS